MTSRTKGTPSDTVVGSATRAKRSASRPSSAIKDASYLSQDPTAADDNNLHLEDDGDADSNTPPKKVAKTAKTPKTTNVKNTKAVAKQPAKKRTRRRSPEVASDDEVAADSLGGIQQQHHTAGDITPVLDEKSLLGDAVYPDGPSVLYAAGMYLARNEGAGSAEAAEPTSLPATQTTSTRSGPTAASYKRRATTAETEDAYEEMDESRDNDDHLTNSSLQPFTQEEIPEHMNYENNMPPAPPVPHGLVDEPQDLHEMAHHQHQYQHQHHDQQRHHEPEDLHPAHQHEPEDLHAMAHDEGGVVAGDAGRAPTRQSARRPATRSRFKPYDTKQTVAAAPAAPRSTSSSSTSRHTTAVAKLATRNNDQQMQDDVEGEMEMKRRRNTGKMGRVS
ncbi:hypothetical protein BDZ88DRAFT_272266 [Geranomyces variabilis]|nr:hypothetical protein BDZ88DRAFT_272266 [Geranomyces variabilis]KAJ3132572.1 hypothetical protein HDU90_006784 [Geranomyces variabilis]